MASGGVTVASPFNVWTADVLLEVDRVEPYLTNKRLLLRGDRKNTSVPLGKVVHFTVFTDGIQVEKGSGKDVYLLGEADWELFGACLEGARAAVNGEG